MKTFILLTVLISTFAIAQGNQRKKSPCGVDDRILTQDNRIGRILNLEEHKRGCTAFLIGKSCMITAAHCIKKAVTVQFQVPLSSEDGEIQHPETTDQYQVDPKSIVNGHNISKKEILENDFAVFRTFKNKETGKYPGEVQEVFDLMREEDFKKGDLIAIRGYGYKHTRRLREFNVQKSDTGPIKKIIGNEVFYDAFTSSGNSGSPIIHLKSGKVIGVHTNGGGCWNGLKGNHGFILRNNNEFIKAVSNCLKEDKKL